MRMDASTGLRCLAAARCRDARGITTLNAARLDNRQNPAQYTTDRATTPPEIHMPRRVVNSRPETPAKIASDCGRMANHGHCGAGTSRLQSAAPVCANAQTLPYAAKGHEYLRPRSRASQ